MNPFFVIEDEELVAQFPQLKKIYNTLYSVGDLEDVITELSPGDMKATILSLPKGAQDSIKHLASKMVSDGRLDDVSAVFMPEYLHASINKPYIRRLFSELKLGDTVQELTYIMKYSVDDDFDAEFITDILGIGMVIEWITPKINSLNNTQQVFGSSEEKFYSQTNHLNGLKDLKKSLIKEQKNLIKDRGYIWNSYLDGSNT